LSTPRNSRLLFLAKIAFAVAVVVAVAYALVREWQPVTAAMHEARPRWGVLALSGAIVLANYALLIEAWRIVLAAWEGERRGAAAPALGFWESARIWSVSNLGRYIPGKVWQMGSMAVMAQERGVSGITAAGAAVVVTLINTVAGFVVLALTGAGVLHVPPLGIAVIALLGLGLLFAPRLIPWLGSLAGRLLRRPIVVGRIPHTAIWLAALISAASWVVYGVAFRVMAVGALGSATGAVGTYIAVFTASYLAGFLALIAPGGVGVREIVMFAGLRQAGFTGGEATLLVVASRVWLTILEIVPAVLFLAHRWVRPRRSDGPIESTR
jgi:uncharacterized membrane protein YbhN (UPF0104 family)